MPLALLVHEGKLVSVAEVDVQVGVRGHSPFSLDPAATAAT
jgi:hypothetical protein